MKNTDTSLRCCFVGQNKIYGGEVKEVLIKNIMQLVEKNNVTDFLVGKYGRFEMLCAVVISELKNIYSQLTLSIVVPYEVPSPVRDTHLYYCNCDNIYSADIPKSIPPRHAVMKTAQFMIDRSDFLVCYVENELDRAHKALKYAQKSGHLGIINIANVEKHFV